MDLRRWRRLEVTRGLEAWAAGEDWSSQDGALVLDTQGLVTCLHREDLPARYEFEALIRADSDDGFAVMGLAYGSSTGGAPELFALLPGSYSRFVSRRAGCSDQGNPFLPPEAGLK